MSIEDNLNDVVKLLSDYWIENSINKTASLNNIGGNDIYGECVLDITNADDNSVITLETYSEVETYLTNEGLL